MVLSDSRDDVLFSLSILYNTNFQAETEPKVSDQRGTPWAQFAGNVQVEAHSLPAPLLFVLPCHEDIYQSSGSWQWKGVTTVDTKMFPLGWQKPVRSQRTKITALHEPYTSQFYHRAPENASQTSLQVGK